MPTLFLPQAQLEEWAVSEKADMKEGQLVIAGESRSYPLSAAVHFKQLVTGADDRRLLNKVKTQKQLEELGAEQMAESVLLGETAYEVVTGFVVQADSGGAKPGRPTSSETNLLADFLLTKLS